MCTTGDNMQGIALDLIAGSFGILETNRHVDGIDDAVVFVQ